MRKSHKEELYTSAFKLFILHSFNGVSIIDIEKESGYTRGAIFHYADTKEDLYRKVMNYYLLEEQIADLKLAIKEDTDLREWIDAFIKVVDKIMKRLHEIIGDDAAKANYCRAYLNILMQTATFLPDLHKRYLRQIEEEEKNLRHTISRCIEKGDIRPETDAALTAKIFMDIFYGNAYKNALGKGLNTKQLKKEMLAVYESLLVKN